MVDLWSSRARKSRTPSLASLVVALLLAPLSAHGGDEGIGFLDEDAGYASHRSVVAVIDSGVNPFHAAFRDLELLAPGSLPVAAVDASTGRAPLYVPIEPIGDFADGAWLDEVLQVRTLYRFAGTNLLYYSMLDEVVKPDPHGHGTGTAGTVLANAPDVIIVMVQTDGARLFDAIKWAGQQDWIDVVSISWGCGLNCGAAYAAAVAGVRENDVQADAAITKAVWDSGKLLVNSAGNDATVHWTDTLDGPPWMIAVGGVDAAARAETRGASKLPDVVADYIVQTPRHDSVDAYRDFKGTSFSAPTVAGALAAAIQEVREATGHVGGPAGDALVDAGGVRLRNSDFRAAMNASGTYWSTEDWRPDQDQNPALRQEAGGPLPPPLNDEKRVPGGVPINPVAPWLQMGWGYVNGDHAATIAAALADGQWPAAKSDEVYHYMVVRDAARAQLWPHPGPLVEPVPLPPPPPPPPLPPLPPPLPEPVQDVCDSIPEIMHPMPC